MTQPEQYYDVVIIGAGPAGSLAASLLTQQNFRVLVIEKQHFPRFSIGESLLPQSMVYLEQANLLQAIEQSASKLGFQFKNGASFFADNHYSDFIFEQKFSQGPSHTYQVKRASFDQLLAQEAERQGAEFRFGYQVVDVDCNDKPVITVQDEQAETFNINAEFLLDASGFARVLPNLLDLSQPSDFPVRSSLFCHVDDNIATTDDSYDRNKILIETHPKHKDVWFWLIPFADGTASLGCVAEPQFLEQLFSEDTATEEKLDQMIAQTQRLKSLLSHAKKITSTRQVTGYSVNVKQLYGNHFALLGNAGEFLDPIFSSGVTIAFKSAKLASDALTKQLNGNTVDWQAEFAQPLQQGVDTFRAFVDSWYKGQFQDIIHFKSAPDNIRRMICSILAGYAWDHENPFVQQPNKRLDVLGELCGS